MSHVLYLYIQESAETCVVEATKSKCDQAKEAGVT